MADKKKAKSEQGMGVKTPKITFRILEQIEESDGARISDLAREIGSSKSTIYRHLCSLHEEGYVIKNNDEYQLSLKFLSFGESAKKRWDKSGLIREKLREIADKTGERAQFLTIENNHAVFVHIEQGEDAVEIDTGVGKTVPLHATSAGKAILAHLPEDKVSDILSKNNLQKFTKHTITEANELFEELGKIREQGFSQNNQERIRGVRAIGVPILKSSNEVVGAISVAGPSHRLVDEWFHEELPTLLLGTVNEIELKMEYEK
jgi:DNA-binding IclR family transcriptional regulator